MANLCNYLEKVDYFDENFVGTIALRSEEVSLPNGSKIALGLDGKHWILVYQEKAKAPFQVFEYDSREMKIFIDKKIGGEKELGRFKELVRYFFLHAQTEELVTILPPQEN
ncbi:MAG: hypothetical protein WCV91_04315 [Candidatus Margulisiibacteriota bacterium]